MPLTNPGGGASPPVPPAESIVTPLAAIYLYAEGFHPDTLARGTNIVSVTYDAIGMFWFITCDYSGVAPQDVAIAATVETNGAYTIAVANAGEPSEWNVFAYDAAGALVPTPNISITWSQMESPTEFP